MLRATRSRAAPSAGRGRIALDCRSRLRAAYRQSDKQGLNGNADKYFAFFQAAAVVFIEFANVILEYLSFGIGP